MANRFITTSKNKIGCSNKAIPVLILSSEAVSSSKSLGPKCLWYYNSDIMYFQHHSSVLEKYLSNYSLYISTGFESDKILKRLPNQKIIENPDYLKCNEAEDIRLFINSVQPESCLIINGNSNIDFDISKMKKTESQTVFTKTNKKDIGVLVDSEKLIHLEYGTENHWSGLVYLKQEELLIMKKLLNNKNYKHLYFFEVINLLIQNNGTIKAYENINF